MREAQQAAKTLNLAHKGFSGKYPENTRRAFLAAIEEGRCDGFESDVHLSADGEPVIIHDAVLERTSNGSGMVKDHRFSALRELDIGSWKGEEFAGERILHLDELLEIVLDHHLVLNGVSGSVFCIVIPCWMPPAIPAAMG